MNTVDEMPAIAEGQSGSNSRSLRTPRSMAEHLSPHMAPHVESGTEGIDQLQSHIEPHTQGLEAPRSGLFRRLSNAARRVPGAVGSRMSATDANSINLRDEQDEYDSEMVDLLDVIGMSKQVLYFILLLTCASDPEVATLSTLTNVQNSLFVPNLGRLINRRPTYNLTRRQTAVGELAESRLATARSDNEKDFEPATEHQTYGSQDSTGLRPPLTQTSTISSTLSVSRYAVLPHGESLAGWTPEEKAELNDLVRHMLHSRRAAFKRGMKGFGQYVKRRKWSPSECVLESFH
jgi:hypothetical protein